MGQSYSTGIEALTAARKRAPKVVERAINGILNT